MIIRPLQSHEDLLACVRLQHEVWGDDFQECVPPSLLKVSQRIGGITAGAFNASGELLGFVFGLTGIRNGRVVHWSDMLAVRSSARGRGIGRMLKEHQRRMLKELHVETICWTFDPLAARNAHLNLNRLGAEVVEYVADMYPPTGSPLHGTVPTDRLLVAWDTAADDGIQRTTEPFPAGLESTPILEGGDGADLAAANDLDGKARPALLRVAIPVDFDTLLAEDSAAATRWRLAVRDGLTRALRSGYTIVGLWTDPSSEEPYYLLADNSVSKDCRHDPRIAEGTASSDRSKDPGSLHTWAARGS